MPYPQFDRHRVRMKPLAERIAERRALLTGAPRKSGLPNGLTPREGEVLRLIACGFTNREIGDALHISDRTVATHARNIFDKVGAANRAEATAYAVREGLVD